LQPLRLSANALAIAQRVPATRIQAIIKGQRAITADTALRLGRYLGTTPEVWVKPPSLYELEKAKRDTSPEDLAWCAAAVASILESVRQNQACSKPT
jgi:addiction module HigA family antidote